MDTMTLLRAAARLYDDGVDAFTPHKLRESGLRRYSISEIENGLRVLAEHNLAVTQAGDGWEFLSTFTRDHNAYVFMRARRGSKFTEVAIPLGLR